MLEYVSRYDSRAREIIRLDDDNDVGHVILLGSKRNGAQAN